MPETERTADGPATRPGPPPRRGARITLRLLVLAAVASIVALVVAILGRERGDGPTLRAMAATESMSDDQARAVADNTGRGGIRERTAGHRANREALSCPPQLRHGTLAVEINDVEARRNTGAMEISVTGGFARNGSIWTLNTHFNSAGVMFTLRVLDGELRVCDIDAAPVP